MEKKIEEVNRICDELIECQTARENHPIGMCPRCRSKYCECPVELARQIKELLAKEPAEGQSKGFWEVVASKFPPCDPTWPVEKIEKWLMDFQRFLGVILPRSQQTEGLAGELRRRPTNGSEVLVLGSVEENDERGAIVVFNDGVAQLGKIHAPYSIMRAAAALEKEV